MQTIEASPRKMVEVLIERTRENQAARQKLHKWVMRAELEAVHGAANAEEIIRACQESKKWRPHPDVSCPIYLCHAFEFDLLECLFFCCFAILGCGLKVKLPLCWVFIEFSMMCLFCYLQTVAGSESAEHGASLGGDIG